jgi:hypothetical protein
MSGRAFDCVVLLFVVAVAGGCGRTGSPTAQPASSAVPSGPAPTATTTSSPPAGIGAGADLIGTYVATIPEGVNASPGEWTLTVDAGAVTFTRPDGQSFSPGAVKELTAGEITLAADPGCPVQTGTPTDGRYRWAVDGTTLTLTLISDSCQDRIDTLTTGTWAQRG